jgi:ribonuclease HII
MLLPLYPNLPQPQLGVDEAGRGSFWGPLVAAAVILPPVEEFPVELRDCAHLIRDSKRVSEKRRLKLYDVIMASALGVGVGRVEAETVDSHNAFWANSLAFRMAVDDCLEDYVRRKATNREAVDACLEDFGRRQSKNLNTYSVILDGHLPLPDTRAGESSVNVEEGDATYLHVAAASIIAKVSHDRIVESWCEAHPREAAIYGLASNKGYGTAAHRKAIQRHGPLADHRRAYLKKTAPAHAQSRIQIVDDEEDGDEDED